MNLQDSESIKLSHHIPIRRTDFSIDTLLKKDTEQQRCNIPTNLEVIPTFGDEDDMRLTCCSQIGSNYDSDQEASTSSSPEPMNSIVDGKDHQKYLGLTDEDLTTFSWLSCTRFKPPKLPRSKKRSGCKRYGRGPRIPFAPHQIAVLESTFSKSQYLSSDCIHSLADTLHLSETRVKIWFQNRRARYRREKEASSMAQNNGDDTSHFYSHHHTLIPSTSVLPQQNQNGDDIGVPQALDKGIYHSMTRTSPSAEDLTNSKKKLLIPDFISQQLHHYRQVQEYLLHQQEQMRYVSTSSSSGGIDASNAHSIQTKPLFSPASSILHSVLQSSTAPASSTPLFPGGHFQSASPHAPKGFPNSSQSQILGNSTTNRFLQFNNNPYSPLSTFPIQFR